MRRSIGSLLLIFLAGVSLSRSQVPTAPELSRGPDGHAHTSIPGINVPPYPNLPFSGTDSLVWTRSIGNGGSVTVSETAKVARDSEGRTYRERHHLAPTDADQTKTLFEFSILDPTSHSRTTCEVSIHRCVVTSYHPRFTTTLVPAGPYDNGRRYLTRDNLGTQTIGDLPVVGTRETVTTASGTAGNNRPITATREFWYSSDLKTNLAVTRTDEIGGKQSVRLDIQSRTEPDPALFAIPSDYTVVDRRTSPGTSN